MNRVGDWMQTASGKVFWPLDPRADEVDLSDIAHALANQCRFAGHCREFYSVAQHSVLVSLCVPREDALWALLHDASEAYLVDLPSPVKRSPGIGPEYVAAERRVMAAVCDHFGLPREMPESVRAADTVILCAEMRDLMAPPPMPWRESETPLPDFRVVPDEPRMARANFLARYREVRRG